MIRNLLIFSGIALLVSMVCLSGAAIVASKDIQANGGDWSWKWGGETLHWDYDSKKDTFILRHPSSDIVTGSSVDSTTTGSKSLNWTGGNRVDIALPAEVTYVQGEGNTITVSGPQTLVDAVVIDGDQLRLSTQSGNHKSLSLTWKDGELKMDDAALKVTITAPSINDLSLSGAGRLILQNYDQPSLKVGVSGMGDIEGTGRTDSLTVYISGAGDADLGGLITRDADVRVSGKGDASIAPTGAVALNVSGMGNVKLKTQPASLSTNTSGLGKIKPEYSE